jgi:hypothetical protein
MKVLLKHAQTGLYYGKENVWISEVAEAVDFCELQTAGRMVMENELEDVNVVLNYDEPHCELALNPSYCIGGPPLRENGLACSNVTSCC